MFFMRSIIEDVEGYEFSDFRILMNISCTCFLNNFLLLDSLIFWGKTFHIRTPNPENEFFSCSRREDFSSLLDKRFISSQVLLFVTNKYIIEALKNSRKWKKSSLLGGTSKSAPKLQKLKNDRDSMLDQVIFFPLLKLHLQMWHHQYTVSLVLSTKIILTTT